MMKKKIFFLKRRPKNRHLIWVEKITNIGEIKLKFLVKMGTQVLITHVTKYTWAGGISSFLFPPFLLVSEYQFHTGVDL